MLCNVLEDTPRYIFQPPNRYDEDEEVISYREKDVIDTIVYKIVSNDPTFKIEAHTLLSEFRDLFFRSLNPIPATVDPLRIEIDRVTFETRKAQGPPRLMTAEKDAHMAKLVVRNGLV